MTKAVALTASGASPSKEGQRPQLQRAELKVYEPVAKPWGAATGAQAGTIAFQFNPNQVTIAKRADWRRDPSTASATAGPVEFTGSGPCTLSVTMFLDATSTHDNSVVAAAEQLLRCCVPTESSVDQKKPSPPLVVFHWGRISSFPAFVTSVSIEYSLFAPDGTPIRARCAVELEEMPVEAEKTNPTSGALAVRRVHTTVAGDSLASVAYREYGDPALWRRLAEANGIDDPLRVLPGSVLMLPRIDELLAGTG